MKHMLVTGGLGYIGSHTSLLLLEAGYKVTIIDNLSNTFERALDHLKRLAGPERSKHVAFHKVDMRDKPAMEKLFADNKFDCVIHFAGYKAVGESNAKPIEYYDNNFVSSVVLLQLMRDYDCKHLVFSSSATVYGVPEVVPLTESHKLSAINPYGRTKLFQEEMFRDVAASDAAWRIILLRYFNPVGAHPSGELGEHPVGVPNNLMPYVQQVALKQREQLNVFGDDYATPDGTGVRDYIHVMDLAAGHVAAVSKLLADEKLGCKEINLGTGQGTSVLEMVRMYEEVNDVSVPFKIAPRRQGDAAAVWADTKYGEDMLGFKSKYGLKEMCLHQHQWGVKYPKGYLTEADKEHA